MSNTQNPDNFEPDRFKNLVWTSGSLKYFNILDIKVPSHFAGLRKITYRLPFQGGRQQFARSQPLYFVDTSRSLPKKISRSDRSRGSKK